MSVCSMAGLGNGVPDLLIGANGRTFLAEMKRRRKVSQPIASLTADQRAVDRTLDRLRSA